MKPSALKLWITATLAAGGLAGASPALADEALLGGKLLLTGGVSTVEGAAGGGLSTWAVIAGDETRDGVGGAAHVTGVHLKDFSFRTWGGAIGAYDRVEISFAQQEFDTGKTGSKLGLGNDFTFKQTVVGAKVRLFGDAVYEQDNLLPQVSVGAQYKKNNQAGVIAFVGGKKDEGVDVYVVATKLFLANSLLLSGGARLTRANQTGLLGFGGDQQRHPTVQFEGSVGYLLTRKLAVGGEYRTKPDNLGFARENDWMDVYAAYAINHHLSVTAAYVDLGDIATFKNQRGVYLSLQAGF